MRRAASTSAVFALFAMLAAALFAAPAIAQSSDGFVAAVTEDQIAVSSTFSGARIFVFGATPSRRADDVVVVVRGPGGPVTVMRREPVFGLWVNSDPVKFEAAPGFFAVMTAKPLSQIASRKAIWELGLDPAGAARLTGATPADADPGAYRAALVRLKRAQNLYQENPRGLTRLPGGLYRSPVALPANAPPGEYRVEVYLFRNRKLVGTETSTIQITRIGVERMIHDFADRFPVLYGITAVLVALGAGWLASVTLGRRT